VGRASQGAGENVASTTTFIYVIRNSVSVTLEQLWHTAVGSNQVLHYKFGCLPLFLLAQIYVLTPTVTLKNKSPQILSHSHCLVSKFLQDFLSVNLS
jgi:hypothetical protein